MQSPDFSSFELGHAASLSGSGLYSYIYNDTTRSPQFHQFVESSIKNTIGDFNNPYMDAVSGRWHRWRHGHESMEVLGKLATDPLGRGKSDLGHLLTDLFTKDGLPLPFLSKDYLGGALVATLEGMGVKNPIRWLNMNGFDHFFGGISLIEAGQDLHQALTADIVDFTWGRAFDTFGEGSLELYFGLQTSNIALVASGVLEYTAGAIELYRDITYVEPTIIERIISNLPNQSELTSAFGFYLMAASLRNYILYSKGAITKEKLVKRTTIDVSVSLSSFTITKSLIATFATGATGGLLLPVLIGGGTSLLLREIFRNAFPDKIILITEDDLWEQSPFQYESPWNEGAFTSKSIWSDNVFEHGNIWQEEIFKKE